MDISVDVVLVLTRFTMLMRIMLLLMDVWSRL